MIEPAKTLYSVQKLAKLSGISIRTLHHYDKIGLLKPTVRSKARYRLYGEKELLRLQQILFYRELDCSLAQIRKILNARDFDVIRALKSHKTNLAAKHARIANLLDTIDRTILKLKGKSMLSHKDLYAGFPKGRAKAYRKEAMERFGRDAVLGSEAKLTQMTNEQFHALGAKQQAITQALRSIVHLNPESKPVQDQIAKHYEVIRMFWGTAGREDKQSEAYKGLGNLYLDDERYTAVDGKPDPEFAKFMCRAMSYFADSTLK
jgi:DNA-binding transcriptional MerR regulator